MRHSPGATSYARVHARGNAAWTRLNHRGAQGKGSHVSITVDGHRIAGDVSPPPRDGKTQVLVKAVVS